MPKKPTSTHSLHEASRSRASFSGHGKSLGAAGRRHRVYDPENSDYLREHGQYIAISPHKEPFEDIKIGVEWDNIAIKQGNFFSRFFKKAIAQGVDLDLGCLYELEDGSRGAIQAFGEKFGAYDVPPYIDHSGDERTGNLEGHDEYLLVNGAHWSKIKRLLIYVYIYNGAPHWEQINPRVVVDVPGEHDLIVTLSEYDENLPLCVIGGLEQVRGGIKLTNYTEYFPGHEEMDRAFGFGLSWVDGKKT